MTLPGPSGVALALGLLAWGAGAVAVGEAVRLVAARWVASWRELELLERGLLDFYLGGATMFLVAALPLGAFVAPVVYALPAIGAALVLVEVVRRRRHGLAIPAASAIAVRPAAAVVAATALALLAFELAVAGPIGTGNTYDSSLLTLYVARLLQQHSIPLSFQPYASVGLLYPQGATVWLGWAQLDLGLPAARTSLLVTPLFLALAPVGAYVFARRAVGREAAGIGAALFVAAVGSWTRVLVGGSNDFVIAFPLVFLLAGQATQLWRSRAPPLVDAVAFGLLVGYSAALNPVGAEWLLPTMLALAVLPAARAAPSIARRCTMWAASVLAALVPLIPTLVVLARGWGSPSLTPGAGTPPAGTSTGISLPQFIGSIDPYLFRPTDVWLSPVPALRLEIAVLLTAGLALLVLAPRGSGLARYLATLGRSLGVAGAVVVGLLAVLLAASTGFGPAVRFSAVSSGAELSIWLFSFYTIVAAVPLALLFERVLVSNPAPPVPATPRPAPAARRPGGLPRGTVAVVLALAIVVPGAVLTPTSLAPVLGDLYTDFGNVTAGDFALLTNATHELPAGARVLVAPGSAAEFLPGYVANIVLLYPMVPGWAWINASYRLLLSELTNATLTPAGISAMDALRVGYVAVTGNSSVLYPAFSPAPLLAEPSNFIVRFHDGDAYLFQRVEPP